MQEMSEAWVRSLGGEDPWRMWHGNPLQCSARRSPWTVGPVGYSPWGCQESGHDWSDCPQQYHLMDSFREEKWSLVMTAFEITMQWWSTLWSLNPRGIQKEGASQDARGFLKPQGPGSMRWESSFPAGLTMAKCVLPQWLKMWASWSGGYLTVKEPRVQN